MFRRQRDDHVGDVGRVEVDDRFAQFRDVFRAERVADGGGSFEQKRRFFSVERFLHERAGS